MPPRPTNDRRPAILEHIATGHTYYGAARKAGVPFSTARDWIDPKNPDNAAYTGQVRHALQVGTDYLEEQLRAMAIGEHEDVVLRDTVTEENEDGSTREVERLRSRKASTRALELLMRARAPDRFGGKLAVQVSHSVSQGLLVPADELVAAEAIVNALVGGDDDAEAV